MNMTMEPAGDAAKRPGRGRWLRLGLSLLLLVAAWQWLLRHVDLPALAASMRSLPAHVWLLAGAGLCGGHALRALRLQQEWGHVRPVGFAACLRLVLTHNAAVLLLPLRSGEASYLWLVHRQWGVGWREAARSLLVWRLQDACVLAMLGLLLLLPWAAPARIAFAGSLLVAGIVLAPWIAERVDALLRRILRTGEAALVAGGASARPPHSWLGVFASAGNWTLKVLANGGLMLALAGLPIEAALRAGLGGELAGVQPLQGPAGLGSYEAGVWIASGLPPAWQAAVVAAALGAHAFSLLVALGAGALAQVPAPAPCFEESPR